MDLAMMMYANDYDDQWPMSANTNGTSTYTPLSVAQPPDEAFLKSKGDVCWTWAGNGTAGSDPGQNEVGDATGCQWTWGELAYPYHKAPQIETDPSGLNTNGDPGLANYAMNLEFSYDYVEPNSWEASAGYQYHPQNVKTTDLSNPAGMILLSESGNWIADLGTARYVSGYNYVPSVCPNGIGAGVLGVTGASGGTPPLVDCTGNTSWGVADQNQVISDIKGRHPGATFNIGFADGHVKLMPTGQVMGDGPNYWCLNPNSSWSKSAPQEQYYNCGISNGYVIW
jgi:prepilin-type processing-associated H-X9-DG protein